MRTTILVFAVLLTALTAQAAPHKKLMAVPRLTARTGKNMVLFKDKAAAAEEWGNMLVTVADFVISENTLKRLPGSYEANPIFGKHPSIWNYLAVGIPIGGYGSVVTQNIHEVNDGTKYHYQTYLPVAIAAGMHTAGIVLAEHEIHSVCSQAGITCR